ncbi:hypothetical protein EB796_017064 [Bugula neritina]|uniref:G-protein coupled receptors family 2 profile 2 domain-containing protein n=1 Tax=Bugula neritina TaxID=10212 RepID=A0A7J7JEG3_BUGNE|nr:hypothetical protein EB796_017064 [Bugula neritina]
MDGSTLLGDNLTFSSNTTVVGRDVTTLLPTTINVFHEAKFCINIGEKATTFLDCNLPAGECDQLRILKYAVLAVNIAVVLTTLTLLFIRHKYRLFNQRICFHILGTNLLSSLAFISYDGKHDGKHGGREWCIAQGFFIQAFDIMMFMWIGALTVFLYLGLIKGKRTERHERKYVVVCWLVPILIACLPLITQSYGPCTAPYCWLMEENCGVMWRFAMSLYVVYRTLSVNCDIHE